MTSPSPRFPGDEGECVEIGSLCRTYVSEWRRIVRRHKRPPAPPAEQKRQRRNSASGYVGVYFDKSQGRYRGMVQARGVRKHVGWGATAYHAALLREPEARRVGSRLNFPELVTDHGGDSWVPS